MVPTLKGQNPQSLKTLQIIKILHARQTFSVSTLDVFDFENKVLIMRRPNGLWYAGLPPWVRQTPWDSPGIHTTVVRQFVAHIRSHGRHRSPSLVIINAVPREKTVGVICLSLTELPSSRRRMTTASNALKWVYKQQPSLVGCSLRSLLRTVRLAYLAEYILTRSLRVLPLWADPCVLGLYG